MKTIFTCIAFGLLIALCVADLCKKSHNNQRVVVRTDTVFVEKRIIDTFPVVRYRYLTRWQTDTLYSVDSVKVPVRVPLSQTTYAQTLRTDSDTIAYKAYVSGYRASLDSLRFSVAYRHLTPHIEPLRRRRFYFSHGVQAGLGFGLFSRKPDVYVGYGITFNF